MTLQQVFEKAIEGGWNSGSKFVRIDEGDAVFLEDGLQEWRCDIGGVFMSPPFWKAYGKAMGWNEHEITINVPAQTVRRVFRKPGYAGIKEVEWPAHSRKRLVKTNRWRKEWHRLIDHIADGGTVESFFEQF